MTKKTKLIGAVAAVATVLGLGATAAVFSDDIDQAVTAMEEQADSSDGSEATSWRATWRWGYRPTVRYYSGYRYTSGYRYYGAAHRYGHSYRRAWTPGRWSFGRSWGYRRGYYRYY
jgi:hypothetical protein